VQECPSDAKRLSSSENVADILGENALRVSERRKKGYRKLRDGRRESKV
jgi:hypothetical protein